MYEDTLLEKLEYILGTKEAIKQSLINAGSTSITDDTKFRDYASIIDSLFTNIEYLANKLNTIVYGKELEEGSTTPSIDSYINDLTNIKSTLVDNLNIKGATSTVDEPLLDLVNLINNIIGVIDLTISDASSLFYSGARLEIMNKLFTLCSHVTNCSRMFNNYKGESLDISNIFDTSEVIDMSSMFYNCTSLISIVGLNKLNTSNCRMMNSMFANLYDYTSKLDLSNFDTSKVSVMDMMFQNSSFNEVDISSFNTESTTTMQNMFSGCTNLESIDVSSFDTSVVNRMDGMFLGCIKLEEIDISSFTTTSRLNTSLGTSSMFSNCTKLKKIIINNPNLFIMTNTDMLINTPIARGEGYVYVPDNMVETYKAAENWSTYANQIKGISEME